VSAPAGQPVRLTITRTSDEGCGQQIVFPSLNVRRDLPLNRAVVVDLAMPASGNIAFTCGMDMLRGSIVAQ
jgi:plastocyanin domain-containing protein